MAEHAHPSYPELSLGDYLAVISRRRVVILAVLCLVIAASVAATLVQTPEYRATASVLVRTRETTNLFPLGGATEVTRSVAGEQAFLNSNTFREQAAAASPQPSSVRTISDEGNDDASQRSIIAFEASSNSATVSGRVEPGATLDLLRKPQLEVLIEKVRGVYDHIIIDSPPVLAVVDPIEIAVHADCAVLVVRSGRLSSSELQEAQRALGSARVPIIGTVLVAPSAEVKNVYAHGY